MIYPFQPELFALSSIDAHTIQLHLYRDGNPPKIRFAGISFMPTIMAFICVYIIYYSGQKNLSAVKYQDGLACILPELDYFFRDWY